MRTARLKGGALTVAAVAGAVVGGAAIANAAGNGSNGGSSGAARPDPGALRHGPGETLLQGQTASKVRAAALGAVSGARVIRVETDSAGAAYEAHMMRSNGSEVTVKLDRSFHVTAVHSG